MKLFNLDKPKKYIPSIKETIKRYRLQMLTSSYIYEVLNEDSYLSDNEWDCRAKKLFEIQQKYPKESSEVEYAEMFKDWTGDTAAGLSYDEATIRRANMILGYMKGEIKSTTHRLTPDGV